jgi:DNA-binding MarR family transcriptional regulator
MAREYRCAWSKCGTVRSKRRPCYKLQVTCPALRYVRRHAAIFAGPDSRGTSRCAQITTTGITMGSDGFSAEDLEASRRLIQKRLTEEQRVDPGAIDRMELMFDLARLGTRLARDFESVHRANGLTYAGFRIIDMLWAVGDLEPSRLAHLTASSRASTSSVLNSLEADGLIVRIPNKSNRRLVRVSLTEKGKEALANAIPVQARREQAWLAILTPPEIAAMKGIVHRLMTQPFPD